MIIFFRKLKTEIENLKCIVNSIDANSPISASNLAVAALYKGNKLLSMLNCIGGDSRRFLLEWGYTSDSPLKPLVECVDIEITRSLAKTDDYYKAYSSEYQSFLDLDSVNKEEIKLEIEKAKRQVEQSFNEDLKRWKSLYEYSGNIGNFELPVNIDSYHASLYGMLRLLKDLLQLCMDYAESIDHIIAFPSVEMIEQFLVSKFDCAKLACSKSQRYIDFVYERKNHLLYEV